MLRKNEMCVTLLINKQIICHMIRNSYSTGICVFYYGLIYPRRTHTVHKMLTEIVFAWQNHISAVFSCACDQDNLQKVRIETTSIEYVKLKTIRGAILNKKTYIMSLYISMNRCKHKKHHRKNGQWIILNKGDTINFIHGRIYINNTSQKDGMGHMNNANMNSARSYICTMRDIDICHPGMIYRVN